MHHYQRQIHHHVHKNLAMIVLRLKTGFLGSQTTKLQNYNMEIFHRRVLQNRIFFFFKIEEYLLSYLRFHSVIPHDVARKWAIIQEFRNLN